MKINSRQIKKDFDLYDQSEPLKMTVDKIKQQENLNKETQTLILIDEKQIANQDQSLEELKLPNTSKLEIIFSQNELIQFRNEDDQKTFTQQLNIWITGQNAIKLIQEKFSIQKDYLIELKSENKKVDLQLPLVLQNVGENLVIEFEVLVKFEVNYKGKKINYIHNYFKPLNFLRNQIEKDQGVNLKHYEIKCQAVNINSFDLSKLEPFNIITIKNKAEDDEGEAYFSHEEPSSKTDSGFFKVTSSNMYSKPEASLKLVNLDEDYIVYASYNIQDIKKYIQENKLDDSIFIYQQKVVQLSDDFQIQDDPLYFFRFFKISFKTKEKIIYQKQFDINSNILQVKEDFQKGYLKQSKIDFQLYYQGKVVDLEKNIITLRNEFSGQTSIEFEVRSQIRSFCVKIYDLNEFYKVEIQEHQKVDELIILVAKTINQSLPIDMFYDGQQLYESQQKLIGSIIKEDDENIEVYLN